MIEAAGHLVRSVLLGGLVAFAGVSMAPAATSGWVSRDHVEARLLTAVNGTGNLPTVPAGVEVKLDGQWKTYWRAPGEAGLPPALDWSGSTNLAKTDLLYPAPARLTLLGIQTFGYKHDVIFPVDIAPAKPGAPLDLKLKLDILVCADLCVPQSFNLALSVPAAPATPDATAAQELAKARATVPADSRTSGLSVVSAQDVSDAGKPALQVIAHADRPFAAPDVIAEMHPDLAFGAPRIKLSTDRHDATFLLPLAHKLPIGARLAGRAASLTLLDAGRALEQTAMIAPGASAAVEEPEPSLLATLAIALLGGLILNLMPCVLPVLSLKLLSVMSQGGRAPRAVRAGFLATAAGIVASFGVVAAALIAFKAAGRTVGWGLQFQEPGFIATMAVLVTVFACHVVGLFEVPLPRFVARAAEGRPGPDETLAGHFLTGAFATLLATPCSAPFLGTAVGFALAGDAAAMLAIFLALGVGLALPYFLVAAVPRLVAALPRPGRWMLRLKQAMALPLGATAIWLVGILASQVGWRAALADAALLAAIAALLAGRALLAGTGRRIVGPAVIALALAAIVLPDAIAAQIGGRDAADDTIAWQRFDRDRIPSLVSQGRTVFVDVTADWCLTCQANKRFVLSRGALADRLNKDTVSMQADWTRPDPAIASYLAGYGRYGIPFNIVYGPRAPGGVVLPELLTAGDVGAALDQAGRTHGAKATPLHPLATADSGTDDR